jgi:multidrug efflux pump subunit AcrA (membrane-fusion protein)
MHPLLAELNEKQYEELYHVDDAPIADLRQKALSCMGWWAAALALAGALAGIFIKFPDMVQVPLVIKSEVSEEIYRFPSTVYIEEMLVSNGQNVPAGTAVLEVSSPDIAALANQYKTAQAKLRSFNQHRTVSSENERGILAINIRKIREDIRLKEVQTTVLRNKWEAEQAKLQYEASDARRIYETNQEIYKTGDISKNELHQLESAVLRTRHAYTTAYQNYLSEQSNLQQQIVSQQLEVSSLEKQIARTVSDLSLEAEQLQGTLQSIEKQIAGTYGAFEITNDNHLLLKAARPGTVSFVFEGEKEAQPGTILLKMIYRDAPMYAFMQVNSSLIGKIKAGQQAVLKLDAYPVYEWGSLQGRVKQVSLTPDEKGLFNVTVQLTNYHRLDRLVRIGMRGNGNIIFEERSLFGYVFRKFRQVSGELME